MKKIFVPLICLTIVTSLTANSSTFAGSGNLVYLFAAYLVLWLGFFGYLCYLRLKQKDSELAIHQLESRTNKTSDT